MFDPGFILAGVLFLVVNAMQKMKQKEEAKPSVPPRSEQLLEEIRDLLKLWSDRNRCSSEVKAIAMAHVAEMETKITHMREMADALHRLAEARPYVAATTG